MKPDGWELLTADEKQEYARALLNSLRGQLIVGQAFFHAIKALKKERYPETSNIQDMELLMETLFPMYSAVQAAQTMAFETDPRLRKMKNDAEMKQIIRPPRTEMGGE